MVRPQQRPVPSLGDDLDDEAVVRGLSHKANLCVDTNLERSANVSKGAAFMEVFLFVFLTFVLLWFVWAYMKSIGGVFHRCCVRKPKFRQLGSDDVERPDLAE